MIEYHYDCIYDLEILQWLYDKNPVSVDLNSFRAHASYIPAVLEHILGLLPVLV